MDPLTKDSDLSRSRSNLGNHPGSLACWSSYVQALMIVTVTVTVTVMVMVMVMVHYTRPRKGRQPQL
jgi:heme/copper-type cytochrome/quinol oxidase subunit 2